MKFDGVRGVLQFEDDERPSGPGPWLDAAALRLADRLASR